MEQVAEEFRNSTHTVGVTANARALRFVQLIGTSPAIHRVFALVERVAPTEAGVLLVGESGVGKELVAEAIHQHSRRSAGPMIAVNCASLPATLIEAELFGYEKGSFTGASRSHAGVFERANRGTLLLDEITEMPLDMQTRLLRVLETGRFYRVGGTSEIRTNMRVIASTNRDIAQAVQQRRLREDILYRLAVFPIHVPALRERGEDRVLLAETFLARLNARHGTSKRFTPESFATLWEHDWPGNVRELKNVIVRAFIMADYTLDVSQATLIRRRNGSDATVDGNHTDVPGIRVTLGSRLDEAERSLIEATLHHFEGNKRRTAETLGCSLKTLYNKLHTYARQ
jgi:two-component system, NtrC family, response regulator HydG